MTSMREFRLGFMCAFKAIGYLFSHTSLLRLALIPILINIVLFLGLLWVLSAKFGYLMGLLITKPENWYWLMGYYFLAATAFLVLLTIGTFLLCLIGNLLSSPFHEWITEKVKILEKGPSTSQKFSFRALGAEIKRILITQHKKLGLLLILEIMILLFLLIPGIGAFLSGFFTLFLLAFQFLDFPLEVERLPFRAQCHFVRRHWMACLGFGLAMSCLLVIPIINLFILPIGTIGAALLYYRL
ncbi:MAG: EI24 domain-containing protein [Deltaproteobacteria bacterium]|nr:EI24 domain-containing protein [Deltaproteobacteria bacterium]